MGPRGPFPWSLWTPGSLGGWGWGWGPRGAFGSQGSAPWRSYKSASRKLGGGAEFAGENHLGRRTARSVLGLFNVFCMNKVRFWGWWALPDVLNISIWVVFADYDKIQNFGKTLCQNGSQNYQNRHLGAQGTDFWGFLMVLSRFLKAFAEICGDIREVWASIFLRPKPVTSVRFSYVFG